ncbi:MAG: hypothetical protein K8S14_06950 [Actinomycetia bacterium]|nr:hypothetical protein [Actinomycetes bacterium]
MSGKSASIKNSEVKVKTILEQEFEKVHVKAILKHFIDSKEKYRVEDPEGSILKSGKFVEAVTKALMRYCGKSLPRSRSFHAGTILRNLQNELNSINDTIRIVIPKCCLFIYEIASNRGARHDPDGVDPNEIDASIVDMSISWTLGELIRFSSRRAKDPKEAQELVEALTGKVYPYFEEIDGRFYVNIQGLSAKETALLILYGRYPLRTDRNYLYKMVGRHGFASNNAKVAFSRVKNLCDIDENGIKLRSIGIQKAEQVLNSDRE